MKAVAARHFQVLQLFGQVHVFKFSGSSRSDIRGKLLCLAPGVKLLSPFVGKGFDHEAKRILSRDACQQRRKRLHNAERTGKLGA